VALITLSPEETRAWGCQQGQRLKPGDVVALTGPLGAGKTTLTKGLAEGLGCPDPDAVCSPTFTLIQEIQGRYPVVHVDAYRLPQGIGGEGADDTGFSDYLDGRWVVIVEWAERVRDLLPSSTLWIEMAHEGPTQRWIRWGPGPLRT
jgi:tRNA threonylcarbamoyladenosine biosynthesis protein TsaE